MNCGVRACWHGVPSFLNPQPGGASGRLDGSLVRSPHCLPSGARSLPLRTGCLGVPWINSSCGHRAFSFWAAARVFLLCALRMLMQGALLRVSLPSVDGLFPMSAFIASPQIHTHTGKKSPPEVPDSWVPPVPCPQARLILFHGLATISLHHQKFHTSRDALRGCCVCFYLWPSPKYPHWKDPFVLSKHPFLPPIVPSPAGFRDPVKAHKEANAGAPRPLLRTEGRGGPPGRRAGSVGGWG